MINQVLIHNIATYKTPVNILPKKLNFVFGSNGSGKTTISNLLRDYNSFDDCTVEMTNVSNTSVLVYNRNFVEDNFKQISEVKGIFSLGEESIQTQEDLQELHDENQEKEDLIEKKKGTLQNFKDEILTKEQIVIENCWKLQQDLGNNFSKALVGYRNSKRVFFDKCILTFESWDKENIESIEKIKEKYDIAYSNSSQLYSIFTTIDLTDIQTYEESDLLQKIIIGSTDTPIGQFIELLNNSDWIKQGLEYLPHSNSNCPFCQQTLSIELQQEIQDYFDEEYERDYQSIKKFIEAYNSHFNKINNNLSDIIESTIPFIDLSELKDKYQIFDNQLKLNNEKLQNKIDSPSLQIELTSFKELFEQMNQIIEYYNSLIENNNYIVTNQNQEKENCKKSLWNYVVNKLEVFLTEYLNFLNGRTIAKISVKEQISTLQNDINTNKINISTIEDTLTSVTPTVTKINEILEKFDFKGFYLAESQHQKGNYLILREDGTNAKDTLSEGEYNFITFLYFYFLVYGSQEKTGITTNKVVVIDDPISSLDSNVLFIVSTLVKNLISDCRNNTNGIKQAFILTHNVYFHKEITFLGSRQKFSQEEVLYGIVRKKDNISSFQVYDKNPIESTYQLMWRELDSENISSITAFNTMRRILEYYFKIIGAMDYEKCINEFDGTDKTVCKALVSGINDGSHFISDDFVVGFDQENMEQYKRIFQLVFEKLGHIQHYNMMTSVPVS